LLIVAWCIARQNEREGTLSHKCEKTMVDAAAQRMGAAQTLAARRANNRHIAHTRGTRATFNLSYKRCRHDDAPLESL
jgi:hypothetical protein